MKEKLEILVREALGALGVEATAIVIERPADMAHGDYATNVALAYAKKAGMSPRVLAGKLTEELLRMPTEEIKNIEIAGPGFINFRLSDAHLKGALALALEQKEKWGSNGTLVGKKVIVEYTDPNPFKEFHIGHLMANAIGESISRLVEASGAETKRACYQGDVGMHVAKAVWGIMRLEKEGDILAQNASVLEHAAYLGKAYAKGATAYEGDDSIKKEIVVINKKIYERGDLGVNNVYDTGKQWSLQYFEAIYQKLGTKFDYYFFESETRKFGEEIVRNSVGKVFEQGEGGAIVYKGDETKGLHTRVFVNSEGLPTYEAKELGLAKTKYDTYPYDMSVVVTANEQNAYFKVLLAAMAEIFPELAEKTIHISHGMLRLPTGKMSSRTGDVITAEGLIEEVKTRVQEKFKEGMFSPDEKEKVAEQVAIGAIKYSILRQASGKDIIFDMEQSLSFEGDSGPYLQYTHARTCSLLAKAEGKTIDAMKFEGEIGTLHKYLLQFPEVVFRASEEREPHHVTTYLVELARAFNAYYANTPVLDGSPNEPYKLALVQAVSQTLKKGLELLGIPTPERM
ncbi:MAG: arginine--tRNA ligase [Patescibacteria group bacterium]